MNLKTGWIIVVVSFIASVAAAETISLDFSTGKIVGDNVEWTYPVQVPVKEERSVPFTVQVPYTEEVKLDDGTKKTVVKYRTEERKRIVTVMKLFTEYRTRTSPTSELKGVKFLDLNGEEVSGMKLKSRFANKTAVVQIKNAADITPRLRLLLNENVLFRVVEPPKK